MAEGNRYANEIREEQVLRIRDYGHGRGRAQINVERDSVAPALG